MVKKKKVLNPNATDTLIGEGSKVEGHITCKASLRIEGQLIGNVDCTGDVIIGEKGRLQSQIQARNVYNAGSIEGSVHTSGILSISSSGKVHGDIKVRSLSIAEGGIFEGSSQMARLEEPKMSEEEERTSNAKQERKGILRKFEKKEAVNK